MQIKSCQNNFFPHKTPKYRLDLERYNNVLSVIIL